MRSRAGLTLMELIVALAIAGTAVAAGYSMLAVMGDRRAVALATVDRARSAAAVRGALERWLSSAELTIEEDGVVFRGLDGVRDALPDDELTFRTSARTAGVSPGTTIRLHIDRADSTRERGLVAELSDDRGRKRGVIQIDPDVRGLDARYLSVLESAREWSASWVSSSMLPLAVDMRFHAAVGDTLRDLLATPLIVPLGSAR